MKDMVKEWTNNNEELEDGDNKANCKMLRDIQNGEIHRDVIYQYLNESISKLDSCINRLYHVSKNRDEEVSKVSSELDKVLEVLDNVKKIDKVCKYDRYGNELVQQRIQLMEVDKHIKGEGKEMDK